MKYCWRIPLELWGGKATRKSCFANLFRVGGLLEWTVGVLVAISCSPPFCASSGNPFLSGKCILRGKGRDWMNFCGIFICQGRARSSRSIGKLVCSCPCSFLGVIDFIEKNFHLGLRKRKSLFDVLFYRKERKKKWINKFKNNLNYYLRKNLAVCLYRFVINICREFLSVISLSI